MGNCGSKLSDGCGRKVNAKCVDYEGEFHEDAKLEKCDKPSVEDVIEDINDRLDELKTEIDLSELGNECLEYVETEGKILVKDAIKKMESEICRLSEYVGLPPEGCDGCDTCSPVFNELIECAGLDLGALVDDCGEVPSTVKDLLQVIINKLDE